jgi:hypothetical protein
MIRYDEVTNRICYMGQQRRQKSCVAGGPTTSKLCGFVGAGLPAAVPSTQPW